VGGSSVSSSGSAVGWAVAGAGRAGVPGRRDGRAAPVLAERAAPVLAGRAAPGPGGLTRYFAVARYFARRFPQGFLPGYGNVPRYRAPTPRTARR
jgi:hypothetical protein